jgi:hypothetical protein
VHTLHLHAPCHCGPDVSGRTANHTHTNQRDIQSPAFAQHSLSGMIFISLPRHAVTLSSVIFGVGKPVTSQKGLVRIFFFFFLFFSRSTVHSAHTHPIKPQGIRHISETPCQGCELQTEGFARGGLAIFVKVVCVASFAFWLTFCSNTRTRTPEPHEKRQCLMFVFFLGSVHEVFPVIPWPFDRVAT